MTLDELHDYLTSQYDAEPQHLFRQDPGICIFKRADNGTWFAATKNIERKTLGMTGEGRVGIVNVKLDPFIVASLQTREGFGPAWHMGKKDWITILLDSTVEDAEIQTFIDMSFALVAPRRNGARNLSQEKVRPRASYPIAI